MSPAKLVIITILANIFEWYDYTLFSNFADVIGKKFFSYSNSNNSMINVFLLFAVGYVLRPLGGILFGAIGDRVGRKNAFAISVTLMGLPTFIIGLLPTYEMIGIWSTIIIVILRMLQGISMGGVLTTSICFTVEHTNPKYQNFFSSISMASICAGILLGSFSAYATRILLSQENFLNWGWRIPFLISIVSILIGLYIKKYAEETQTYKNLQNDGTKKSFSLLQILKSNWSIIIASILINATGSIIFYLQTAYLANYLKFQGISAEIIDKNASLAYLIMIPVTLISGFLTDLIGGKRILIILNLIIIATIIPALNLIDSKNMYNITIAMIFLGSIAAAYISAEAALQANLYSPSIRNTALAISYNTATTLFGSTAPLVCTTLTQIGSINWCGYYLIFFALMSIISIIYVKNNRQ